MISAVAPPVPTFLISPARIGAKQNAAWLQRGAQFLQHSRQFLTGDMKQRGVSEHTIKVPIGQIKLEEILLPHLAFVVSEQRRRGDEVEPRKAPWITLHFIQATFLPTGA